MLTRITAAKNKNINPYPIHVAGPLRTFGVGGTAAASAIVFRKKVEQIIAVKCLCNNRICTGYQLDRTSEFVATLST